MRRNLLIAMFAAVVLFAFQGTVLADGFMIVHHHRPEPGRELPPNTPLAVKYHRVNVEIIGTLAVTEIDQVFHNPNPRVLEGTYLFPVPPGAAISKFSMFMDGKEVMGEILEKDKARKIYNDIVRQMKDPALLEYVDRGLFKASVYPIPARGDVRIKISYTEKLTEDSNLVRYRYPLNTEKFSSAPLEDVSVTCHIKTSKSITSVVCPSHKSDVVRKSAHEAVVSYEDKNVKPDKDYYLYYTVSDKDFGLSVDCHNEPAMEGYFLLMLSPRLDLENDKVVPKDIVFMFDTSGSMKGDKIKQQAKALKYCVRSLSDKDRFNLVAFSSEPRLFRDEFVGSGDDIVEAACKWIDERDAKGSTNINDTLLRVLEMQPDGERQFMVVLLTDGEPTVGATTVPDEIVKNATAANKNKARIFSIGIGSNLNVHMLDKLAEKNHAASDYLNPKENIEVKISAFFDKIASPVLSGARLKISGLDTFDVYPKEIGDIFKGEQITVLGRYNGEGGKAITLTGKIGDVEKSYSFETTFDQKNDAPYIATLWANRKIAYLLDNIRLHGEKEETKKEIVRLSIKYGIMTPYTSYLVTEDLRRPGNTAAGRNFKGTTLGEKMEESRDDEARNREWKDSMEKDTGAGSANASKQLKKAKKGYAPAPEESEGTLADDGRELMKRAGVKTFYLKGEAWIDSEYSKKAGLPEVKVKAWSDEFFKLLEQSPRLGEYLTIGEKVTVVFDGKVYIVE